MSKNKKRDFKAMFAQHIEKIVLGLAVLGMVYFFMSSFKKGIDDSQTPAELNELAKKAQQHIDKTGSMNGTPAADIFVSKNYHGIVDIVSRDLKYDPIAQINIEPWAKVDQRRMPTFFAVEDLRVASIVAPLAINEPLAVEGAKLAANATRLERDAEDAKKREALRRREERQNKGGSKGGKGGDGNEFRPPQPGQKGPMQPGGPRGREPAPINPADIEPPHPYEKMIGNVKVEVVNMGIIYGLIPYKKLHQSYTDALIKDKRRDLKHNSLFDEPTFTGVLVERAEITDPSVPVDKLTWQNLSNALAEWYKVRGDRLDFDPETLVPQICDPGKVKNLPQRPIPERATYVMTPMPRLANQVWGRNAVHPRIPLAADVNKAETEKMASQVNLGANAAPEVLDFGATTPGATPPQAINPNQPPLEPEEVLEYMMFRCIDPYQVQGHKYRYRVTLSYLNPNYMVDKNDVENPQDTVNPDVVGMVSEPSPISTPPLDEKLVVTKIIPGKRPGEAPKVDEFWYWKTGYVGSYTPNPGDAATLALDSTGRTGGEIAKEFTGMNLGDIFAHVDKIPVLYNHLTSTSEEIDKHHFNMNQAYLVDVHGGEKTPKTLVEEQPEMIYADANGQLRVSRALRDQVTIDNYNKRYTKTDGNGASVGIPNRGRGRIDEDSDPLLRPTPGRKF